MSDVKFVAVVNSFNRLSLLQEGLPSLVKALTQLDKQSAIVIFDAGSTDGTRQWVKEFAQSVANLTIELLEPQPGEDTSFSAGSNFACEHSLKEFPTLEYFYFFETDNWIASAKPISDAIKLLQGHESIAAAGFTVKKHSGEPAGFGASFPTVTELLVGQQMTYYFKLDNPVRNSWINEAGIRWTVCDVVFTSPLLVKALAWQDSGGLDATNFPFSDCDIDWSWRLKKKGWSIAVIETNAVIHDNKEVLSTWSAERVLHFHKARLRLLSRHLGKSVYLITPFLFLRHCLEYIVLFFLVLSGKRSHKQLELRGKLIMSVFNGYRLSS